MFKKKVDYYEDFDQHGYELVNGEWVKFSDLIKDDPVLHLKYLDLISKKNRSIKVMKYLVLFSFVLLFSVFVYISYLNYLNRG